jgi:hypothetical protein
MRALLLFITFILTVSAQCPFPGIPVRGRGFLRRGIAPSRQITEKDGGKEFKVGDIISYSCDRVDLYNHCIHTTRVELENLHEIKCQQNGLWMGSLPNCST